MTDTRDAALLKRWRGILNLSQEAAARVVGFSLRHYQRLETAHTIPDRVWRPVAESLMEAQPWSTAQTTV